MNWCQFNDTGYSDVAVSRCFNTVTMKLVEDQKSHACLGYFFPTGAISALEVSEGQNFLKPLRIMVKGSEFLLLKLGKNKYSNDEPFFSRQLAYEILNIVFHNATCIVLINVLFGL